MNKRIGLALLVALMLMATLALTVISLASLVTVEARHAQVYSATRSLRQAAENTAIVGLSWLAACSGPDVAYTFVPEGSALSIVNKTGSHMLRGEHSDGLLRCDWTATDLSLSQDAAATHIAALQASAWARTSAGRAKLPHALPESVSAAQRVALEVAGREFFVPTTAAGTSWQVRGLLTDSVRGGWRRNLSDGGTLGASVGNPLAETLATPAFGQIPAKGYPLRRVHDGVRSLDLTPVLTDLRLSLGFFNSRNDGRHRLRFHGSVVLWNPLTVPLLAGSQGKMFLVEVVGSPEVTVTNLDAQSSFVVDLDDCPQEDFGVIRQGLRERGLWFWSEVADTSTHGMNSRGLLPGEVYASVSPSPETQPQGLARVLSKITWKLDRTNHGPGWRRPDPTVFLPTDRIEIAVRFRGKVGLRLRPYAGEPARDDAIAAYPAAPLIAVEGIVFPDFLIRTTGEDYSRDDSSGYVIEERRACLRIRLRPREPQELWSTASRIHMKARWNLENPADAAEWAIDHPVLSALDVLDHDASPLAGPLWDLSANRHDATQVGAFASVRLKDVPAWPRISVGTLRHLEPGGTKAWLESMDSSFFGAALSVKEAGVISHNPFLIAADPSVFADSAQAASGLQVVGPFNVNSRDPAAWEAFLRDSMGVWSSDAGGPFDPSPLRGALFFSRPSGAPLTKWGALSEVDLSDGGAELLPLTAFLGLAGQQGVRKLEEPRLVELARRIVELQPAYGWPYASLQAFGSSGLLEQALVSAGINAPFATTSPALPVNLNAGDLLEAWAPVLTVRGDTFKVIGQAMGPSGRCTCELIVQRVAEEHPAAHLGRRYRIISVRFRN
jgi:type II secretory pathway pseudopilin PulG